ncbi:MAG: winged helix-turn-helix domain-containing protein [Candidatus Tyrphobacter sp.]
MLLYEFGPFRLDAERLLLHLSGAPVALGPKVVETLLALVENAGEPMSKRALIDRVWPDGYVEESNLSQNVYVLRKLLRGHGCGGAIQTLPRRGYRFAAHVRRVERSTTQAVRARSWRRAVAAAAVVAVLAAGAWTYAGSRAPDAPMSAQMRLFTMASFYVGVRTRFGLRRSVTLFTRAIGAGGGARDYAGRAEAYDLMAEYGYAASPTLYRRRARSDAERALRIDPRCAHAYAVLGLIALDEGDVRASLRSLTRSVLLSPADADAREWYGIALLGTGQLDPAATQFQMAQQLDPLSIATTAWMASVAYLQHRYGASVAYAQEGLAVAPWRTDLLITLGLAREEEGRYREAIASFRSYAKTCARCSAESAALIAYAYARLGRLEAAKQELAAAEAGPTRASDLALALAAAGEPPSGILRLIRGLSAADRALAAEDPRVAALPMRDLRLFEGRGS